MLMQQSKTNRHLTHSPTHRQKLFSKGGKFLFLNDIHLGLVDHMSTPF